jgi:hypothetical protein
MTDQTPSGDEEFPPIADDRVEVEPDDFDPGEPDDDLDPSTDLDESFRDLALVEEPGAEFVDQDTADTDDEVERRRLA